MMGREAAKQGKLFYLGVDLEGRVPANHPLRRIGERIDFEFVYEEVKDLYGSKGNVSVPPPVLLKMKRRTVHATKQTVEYALPRKVCASCPLRGECTRSKTGRTITRHLRQEELTAMRLLSKTPAAKKDLRTRQHLMERSFARSTRYGFDRARRRGLWRMEIQEYLVCAVQNILTLLRRTGRPAKALATALLPPQGGRGILAATLLPPQRGRGIGGGMGKKVSGEPLLGALSGFLPDKITRGWHEISWFFIIRTYSPLESPA